MQQECKRLLYPVLRQQPSTHQGGRGMGCVRCLAEWLYQGSPSPQRQSRGFLSPVSEESRTVENSLRLPCQDRFAQYSWRQAQDSWFITHHQRRGQQNDPLEKRGSESHNHHIDFQYVVKGVERFGIIDHYTSTPNCKYRPDVIHYDYKKCRTKFYDSTPDEFFIFFPRDWHIAKVANDTDNQDIRVLVIKVDYKD